MSSEAADLARLGLGLADDFERRGVASASGVIRRLASMVVAQAALLDAVRPSGADQACPRCGEAIVQPSTGRPKRWCSDECRRAGNRTA